MQIHNILKEYFFKHKSVQALLFLVKASRLTDVYPFIHLEVGHSTRWSEQWFTSTIKAENLSRVDSHQGSSDFLHGNMDTQEGCCLWTLQMQKIKGNGHTWVYYSKYMFLQAHTMSQPKLQETPETFRSFLKV